MKKIILNKFILLGIVFQKISLDLNMVKWDFPFIKHMQVKDYAWRLVLVKNTLIS